MNLIEIYGKFKPLLKEYFDNNTKRMIYSAIKKKLPELIETYETQHSGFRFKDILYCIINGIDEIPKCVVCGEYVKIKDFVNGFRKTCSVECRRKYEKTEEHANNISKTLEGKLVKENHKYDYLLDGYDYVFDTSAKKNGKRSNYTILNYCNHGDLEVYLDNIFVLKTKRKDHEGCYCLECNKELFETFEPTEEKYNNFLSTYKDFYKKNHFAIDRDFWFRYYPKTYKMLMIYYKTCCEPDFVITSENVEKDYLHITQEANYCILNDITERPKCPYPGCNKHRHFYNIQRGYLTFCEEHKHQTHVSGQELEVYDYIMSFGLYPQRNNRDVVKGCELDFYFPDKNRAIEYNGVWFHSLKVKPEGYHINKFLKCKESGIGLLTIWEDMWKNRPLACEERIKRHMAEACAFFDLLKCGEIDKKRFTDLFATYSLDSFDAIRGEMFCVISCLGIERMYINYDIEDDVIKIRTMFSVSLYNDNWYCDVLLGWFNHYFGTYSCLVVEEDADIFTPELLRRCGDDNYWIEPCSVKGNKGERTCYNMNVDSDDLYDIELTGRLYMSFHR